MTTQPDYHFKGDACKWTGESHEAHGATWFHYELLEGHRKGEIVHQTHKPASMTENAIMENIASPQYRDKMAALARQEYNHGIDDALAFLVRDGKLTTAEADAVYFAIKQ